MEINLVLNQINYDVFVKMTEIQKIKNPKNQFQDSTKIFIKIKKIKKYIKSSFWNQEPHNIDTMFETYFTSFHWIQNRSLENHGPQKRMNHTTLIIVM